MKKTILPIVALLLLGFSADSPKLSDDDREMLLEELTETRDHVVKVVDGLTDEQLNFKPDENSWSIAECVEHIALVETMFIDQIKKTVDAGPNPALKDSLVFNDAELMKVITDRSNKVKTGKPFEPSGKYGSFEETLQAFLDQRNKLIAYVETTDDDLRDRYNKDLPFGVVDGVQFILFGSSHVERHVLQMKEVMDNEDFPWEDEDGN